ncbi:MAG: hypothetical protein WDN72_07310 [Alphaproteobacteria bacterium]
MNLMPCVLPILALKALALAKKAEASARGARLQGVSYAAGVVASFLLIGCAMLALRGAGAAALGWGFQLQQPQFVTFLFLLMVAIALNLFGLFELPVLFGTPRREAGRKEIARLLPHGRAGGGGWRRPAPRPSWRPALGATLALSALPALLIFAALGLGMASPFLLISLWTPARAAAAEARRMDGAFPPAPRLPDAGDRRVAAAGADADQRHGWGRAGVEWRDRAFLPGLARLFPPRQAAAHRADAGARRLHHRPTAGA